MSLDALLSHQNNIAQKGFTVVDNVYDMDEVKQITKVIAQADTSKPTFRKTSDLFAVRQFLKEIPQIEQWVCTDKLRFILCDLFGEGYFIVKTIYFDKPGDSNWFVAYHQDLTISVDHKANLPGYGPWTIKHNQFAVQPPLHILQNNFTVRIHLDDTDQNNGALKVVPGSHLKGIYRREIIDWTKETEHICNVGRGGIMVMRPLLLHASNRTTNDKKRRVIHIEFSNAVLPLGLNWAEKR